MAVLTRLQTIISGVLLWPLRGFMRLASLTREMFCPGRDEPEARQVTRRRKRGSWYSMRYLGGNTIAGRWRYVYHRIRRAGKGTRFRR